MHGLPPFTVTFARPPGGYPPGFALSIDRPESGAIVEAFGVQVSGFVVRLHPGLRRPDRISFRVDGVELWAGAIDLPRPDVIAYEGFRGRVDPADVRCGFDLVAPSFISQRSATLEMVVMLENKETAEEFEFAFGTLTFASRAAPTLRRHPLGVLSVNSLGRSGSSLLCRLLQAHPAFCVPTLDGQCGETFVLGHYARALAVLSSEGALDQVNRMEHGPDFLSLPVAHTAMDGAGEGHERRLRQRIDRIALRHGVEMLEDVAAQVAAYMHRAKPGAEYWVEKSWNLASLNVGRLILPRWREIMLVRDPRAFWRSQIRFHAKIMTAPDAARQHLAGTLHKFFNFRNRYLDRRDAALLLRYEDLVADPGAALARVLGHLGLPAEPETMARVVAALEDDGGFRARLATEQSEADDAAPFEAFVAGLDALDRAKLATVLRQFGYDD